MTRLTPTVLATAAVLYAAGVAAQDATQFEAVPEPPDIPARMESGEVMEPDVTIVRGEEQTVVEYRVNGRLQAVKIIPDVGVPYYLVDADGDGDLDTKRHPLGSDILVNQWVIFSW